MNCDFVCLSELAPGKSGVIRYIDYSAMNRQRLLELGFNVGVSVSPKHFACGGGLKAFDVLGSVFALRKEDFEHIYVAV